MMQELTLMLHAATVELGSRAALLAATLVLACQAAWGQAPFLYVNNNSSAGPPGNSVTGYRFDRSSGALSILPGSPFLTGGDGEPDGALDGIVCCASYLYATNDASGTVAGFAVNPSSGALQTVPGSPFSVVIAPEDSPRGMACTPDGRRLFVSLLSGAPQEHIRIFDIDPATGSLTPNANDPFLVRPGWAHPVDLEMNPDGTLLFVSQALTDGLHGSVGVFRVGADGTLSPVSNSLLPVAGLASGGVLAPGGKRYYVANGEAQINGFSVNADGTLTPLSGSPYPYAAMDVATDESGTFLFASDPTHGIDGRIHVLRIDPITGALSAVDGSPFDHDCGDRPAGLVSTGRFVFMANGFLDIFATTTSAYSFDPVSGLLSSVPGSPFSRNVPDIGATALAIALCPLGSTPPVSCIGDCNGDEHVTVDELVRGVGIALGTLALDQCPAFDDDNTGTVTINELVLAVNHALGGCPTAAGSSLQ